MEGDLKPQKNLIAMAHLPPAMLNKQPVSNRSPLTKSTKGSAQLVMVDTTKKLEKVSYRDPMCVSRKMSSGSDVSALYSRCLLVWNKRDERRRDNSTWRNHMTPYVP